MIPKFGAQKATDSTALALRPTRQSEATGRVHPLQKLKTVYPAIHEMNMHVLAHIRNISCCHEMRRRRLCKDEFSFKFANKVGVTLAVG